MEIFRQLIAALSGTPAWVPLLLVPALTVLSALLFTLLGGRRAYPYPATALGAAGSVLGTVVLAGQALYGVWPQTPAAQAPGTVERVGEALLSTYSMSFELISVVLVVAMVGALALARHGREK